MTTLFILKTLVLLDKVLKLPIRPRHILTWNVQTQTFSFNNSFQQTKFWYFTVLVASVEILLYFGTVFGIIGGLLAKPDVHKHNIDELCVSIYAHMFCCIWLGIEWVFFSFGSEMTEYVNSLFNFQTSLVENAYQFQAPNRDIPGKLGYIYVAGIAIISPFVALILAFKLLKVLIVSFLFDYVQLESLPATVADILSIALFLLHAGILFPVILELITGAGMIYGPFALFIPSVQVTHLKRLIHLASRPNTSMVALREYQKLRVVHSFGFRFITAGAAVGLGFGFYTTMLSITLVIHGNQLLSLILYPVNVLAAVLCIVLVHFGLKFATEAFVLSKVLISHQCINLATETNTNRKYTTRVLRSLRTVGFNCAAIGELTNDRATTYVYSIIDNSITCILMTGDIIAHYSIA